MMAGGGEKIGEQKDDPRRERIPCLVSHGLYCLCHYRDLEIPEAGRQG